VPCTTSSSRLRVKVIDHHTNNITPWLRNTQLFPHRLRILGDPRTRTIDLHIPTHPGQTCLDAILLSLRVLGDEALLQLGDTIGFAVTNHTSRAEPDQPEPTQNDLNSPSSLHLHYTLERTDRLTLFLTPPHMGFGMLGRRYGDPAG